MPELLAIVATLLTATFLVPQIVRLISRGDTAGLSAVWAGFGVVDQPGMGGICRGPGSLGRLLRPGHGGRRRTRSPSILIVRRAPGIGWWRLLVLVLGELVGGRSSHGPGRSRAAAGDDAGCAAHARCDRGLWHPPPHRSCPGDVGDRRRRGALVGWLWMAGGRPPSHRVRGRHRDRLRPDPGQVLGHPSPGSGLSGRWSRSDPHRARMGGDMRTSPSRSSRPDTRAHRTTWGEDLDHGGPRLLAHPWRIRGWVCPPQPRYPGDVLHTVACRPLLGVPGRGLLARPGW